MRGGELIRSIEEVKQGKVDELIKELTEVSPSDPILKRLAWVNSLVK